MQFEVSETQMTVYGEFRIDSCGQILRAHDLTIVKRHPKCLLPKFLVEEKKRNTPTTNAFARL
jgi:hypothetical protein